MKFWLFSKKGIKVPLLTEKVYLLDTRDGRVRYENLLIMLGYTLRQRPLLYFVRSKSGRRYRVYIINKNSNKLVEIASHKKEEYNEGFKGKPREILMKLFGEVFGSGLQYDIL